MITEGFAASTIMPDGITPKSAWRAWLWNGNRIYSRTNNMVWEPGVPTRALCTALGQGKPGETLMVNVLEQNSAQAIRNHMAQDFSPPIYEVDEGEHRMYFTKKSYLVIPRAVPVRLLVPSLHCSCGIYATQSATYAAQYGEIIGRVAMWGHVIEHDSGYRAQFAYPQSFYVPDEVLAEMKAALADYRVPVFSRKELKGLDSSGSLNPYQPGSIVPFIGGISGNGVLTNQRVQQYFQIPAATEDAEEEDDDPTPGDGVRRLRLSDIRKALATLRGK